MLSPKRTKFCKQQRGRMRGYDPVFQNPLYSQEKKSSKENSWNEELLDSLVQKIQISRKVIEQTEFSKKKLTSLEIFTS